MSGQAEVAAAVSNKAAWLRWLGSTSNRTFIVWPLVLLVAEGIWQGGLPRLNPWAAPLLLWGYLQYRLVGESACAKAAAVPAYPRHPSGW